MNNDLKYEIISGTAQLVDPGFSPDHLEQIVFTTQYPGGLFGEADLFVPRDLLHSWAVDGAQRIVIRNGMTVVWEGYITNLPLKLDESAQGMAIHAVGAWGHILQTRMWRKPWADTRVDEAAWAWETGQTGAEKCTLDRNARLRFTPKAEAWTNGQIATARYTAPVGETIKRVTFSYDMQEGAQAWEMGLNTDSEGLWIVSASGTGTQDITLGTPRSAFYFWFRAAAGQTAKSDGTYYGQASSIVVYTETGSINLTEIAKDCAGKDSRLSTDTSLVAANALSTVPFTTGDTYMTLADILDKAAKYGDSSYNQWATGVRESDSASDAKPILFAEVYPALTAYDYAVRLDESNFLPPFEASQDFDGIANYIYVQYQDINGRAKFVTPTDDAALTDSASVTAYGQRDYLMTVQTTDSTVAAGAGKRYLAAHKDAQWRVNGSIGIKGWVRGTTNEPIPACQIRAGKRIQIQNWLNDVSGTGLTFLITGTSYTDEDQTCQITVGQADPLDALLAQLQMGK